MRVFALSDVHVDYPANAKWIEELSPRDFRDDILILAGDVSDKLSRLEGCLELLTRRFGQVLFVPGNHDLWVFRDRPARNSFDKLQAIAEVIANCGASMGPFKTGNVEIIPLFSWYDFSFGAPTETLRAGWMDFHACRWPDGFDEGRISRHFAKSNPTHSSAEHVITFSHFLPRIDLMSSTMPEDSQWIYPALGATWLDEQIRGLGAHLHVFGHSHVPRRVQLDGVTYVSNPLGYPHESWLRRAPLSPIYREDQPEPAL